MSLYTVFAHFSLKGGPWPKLQSEHSKPHWIKIDFDHFEISDSEEEEKEGNNVS